LPIELPSAPHPVALTTSRNNKTGSAMPRATRPIAWLLLAAVTVSGSAIAAVPPPNYGSNPNGNFDADKIAALDAYLGQVMVDNGIPGLATVITYGNDTIWMQTYGRRRIDTAASGTNLVQPDTIFHVASVSKSVTGVLAMKLAQLGYLNTGSNINTYLSGSGLTVSNPNTGSSGAISSEMLLTHTSNITDPRFAANPAAALNDTDWKTARCHANRLLSGCTNGSNDLVYTDAKIATLQGAIGTGGSLGTGQGRVLYSDSSFGDYPLTLKDFLKAQLEPGSTDYPSGTGALTPNRSYLTGTPGSKFSYSNVGASLMGFIVGQIATAQSLVGSDPNFTNRPFEEYAKKAIFTPLGMSDTAFSFQDFSSTQKGRMAYPHTTDDTNTKKALTNLVYSLSGNAAGAPYTVTMNNTMLNNITYGTRPAGGMRTTVADLAKFIKMFGASGSPVLNSTYANAMSTVLVPQGSGSFTSPWSNASTSGAYYPWGRLLYRVNDLVHVSTSDFEVWGHGGNEVGATALFFFTKTSPSLGVGLLFNAEAPQNNPNVHYAVGETLLKWAVCYYGHTTAPGC
jgi:CubicO group peptidase (beta-lactamase class C family)